MIWFVEFFEALEILSRSKRANCIQREEITMAETKLNQSPIKKMAMNNIPIGNSIVDNGVRRTVIESSVKFYKVERGTNVADNLQNLNEQVSNS